MSLQKTGVIRNVVLENVHVDPATESVAQAH